jgi:hypothetical protein
MKLDYGKKKPKPGKRRKLVIQERVYKTIADRNRAMTLIHAYWIKQKVGHFNLFTLVGKNGEPKLYFCRAFRLEEIEKAGFTPDELGYNAMEKKDIGAI